MMSEQRNQSRQRVFKAGKIVVKQGASVFDCIVRNLSDDGACVDLGTDYVIERFDVGRRPEDESYARIADGFAAPHSTRSVKIKK